MPLPRDHEIMHTVTARAREVGVVKLSKISILNWKPVGFAEGRPKTEVRVNRHIRSLIDRFNAKLEQNTKGCSNKPYDKSSASLGLPRILAYRDMFKMDPFVIHDKWGTLDLNATAYPTYHWRISHLLSQAEKIDFNSLVVRAREPNAWPFHALRQLLEYYPPASHCDAHGPTITVEYGDGTSERVRTDGFVSMKELEGRLQIIKQKTNR